MKFKLIYLSAICFLLIVTFFLSAKSMYSNTRVHQHLQQSQKEKISEDGTRFSSHLPVITIDTDGNKVPEENEEKDLIISDLKIFDQEKTRNYLTDEPMLTTSANIRYRGNSSLLFDKKSYLLKLVTENGEENSQEIMGMPSYDEWILNGPFLDKSLIRNYMCMNISAEIMGYAPRVRFCELFVNNEYQGLYVMMERIAIGENRIPITKYKEGNIVSSYIIRADRGDEEVNELNNFTKYTKRMLSDTETIRHVVNIEYPPKSQLKPGVKEYIEQDFSKFEKSLYSYDYNSNTYGYRNYINADSFIDFFIINEFFQNYDAGIFSTYFYKDIRGKLNIGPVWDFNNACDNYMEVQYDGTGFGLQERTWYYMLIKDKAFTDTVIRRYKSLRKTFLNEEYLMDYIDDTVSFLDDAVERNFEVWGYSYDTQNLSEYYKLEPEGRNIGSYEEAIRQLKNFLKKRGEWMDRNIDNLQQYSHESKVKKFN